MTEWAAAVVHVACVLGAGFALGMCLLQLAIALLGAP